MNAKYKIGEVAKLLGITPEAVCFYEDQGIISPAKSEDSGYRYYDVWNIHILIRPGLIANMDIRCMKRPI